MQLCCFWTRHLLGLIWLPICGCNFYVFFFSWIAKTLQGVKTFPWTKWSMHTYCRYIVTRFNTLHCSLTLPLLTTSHSLTRLISCYVKVLLNTLCDPFTKLWTSWRSVFFSYIDYSLKNLIISSSYCLRWLWFLA